MAPLVSELLVSTSPPSPGEADITSATPASPTTKSRNRRTEQRAKEHKELSLPAVSADTIFGAISRVHWNADDNVALKDLSSLSFNDLRLVLSDSPDGNPRVVPLLSPDTFAAHASAYFYSYRRKAVNPVLMLTALTPGLARHRHEILPGFCWGALFARSCEELLGAAGIGF